MNSVRVKDLSKFMSLLFSSERLDGLYISEGIIETFITYKIDGYTNKAFFDNSESLEEFATWGMVRPLAKDMIKGKRVPVSIKLTLFLPSEAATSYVDGNYSDVRFLINVRFENGALHLISATSTKTFTLDKSFEKSWDTGFERFLSDLSVEFDKDL